MQVAPPLGAGAEGRPDALILGLAVVRARAHGRQHVRRLRGHASHAGDVPQVRGTQACPPSLATVAYIGATILFILSLGGLSNPETARRGNLFGIVGMAIAVLATVLGPRVTPAGIPWIVGALRRRRQHRPVRREEGADDADARAGRADAQPRRPGRLPGRLRQLRRHLDRVSTGAEKAIHEVEIYIGILIGAVTFSGSVIAFGKLSGKIGGKPLLLPGAALAQPGRAAGA